SQTSLTAVKTPLHRSVALFQLHAASLRRPTSVMWNRGHINNRGDRESSCLQRADSRLAARTWSLDKDINLSETMLHRLTRWFLLICHACYPSPALLLRYSFLPAGYRFLWPTTGTCIRARALSTHRKIAAVAQTTIATDLDQPFDVHIHFTAHIALDLVFTV